MENRKVKFLAKFTDSKGVWHTAIHSYDRVTGFVDMMKDYKFEDGNYPFTDVEYERLRDEQEKFERESRRFRVVENSEEGSWKVQDTVKDIAIATFFNKEEAEEYALIREGNDKYLSEIEDDPFL